MKMRKVLSIALALSLAIGMLAGCGGQNNGVDTSADISAFTDTEEKLNLEWYGYYTLPGCESPTASELLLEDKFNVEITPIFSGGADYLDKKNALLQSNQIPDLIYELDPMYLFSDARDEYLLEVPYAAIAKYAPSLFANVNDKAPAVWSYSYYDGKNYGLPNLNYAHTTSQNVMYRKDWLDKLGLEVPETIDELHDVISAFVNEDPDGNGKDDTYGTTVYQNHYQYFFSEIFGAYNILPFDWQEVNGEIVYGGLREDCETVLQILADWYEEGLIYPAFVEVDKSGEVLAKSNVLGYVSTAPYHDPTLSSSVTGVTREIAPEAEYVYGKPVKGPDGHRGRRSWGYPCHVVSFGATGEDAPVKTTRMLKMFETIYNDEALLKEIRIGKEGEQYTIVNGTETSIFVPTENYSEAAQRRLAGYEFGFSGPTFWTPFAPSEETYNNSLSDAYKNWKNTYATEEICLVDAFYKVDIVPSATTYLEDVRNGQMAIMAEIIQGKKSADQYIEEFTKIWESTGGPQMLGEAQEMQNVLEEIYGKIGLK